MGFFSKLFGGGGEVVLPFSPSAGEEQRSTAIKHVLEQVATSIQLGSAVLATRDDETELRGWLHGTELRAVIDSAGLVDYAGLRYASELADIDLEYDPELESARQGEHDGKVFVGPGVFLSYAGEAAEFRKLPSELQQRTIDGMRRLRLLHFRSRREELELDFHDLDLADIADPVRWLADALSLAGDVARARGVTPPGPPKPTDHERMYARALELARQIAARIPSARVVERRNDDQIDVSWSEAATPMQVVVGPLIALVSARADSEARFDLTYDPDVEIDAEPDDDERRTFVARSVYAENWEQAAVVRALPPAASAELVETMRAEQIDRVWLGDGGLALHVDTIDGNAARAIALAGMLARIAPVLPSRAPREDRAERLMRCGSCRGLWLAGPGRPTCANCGATS
jgi:hypothetical protein